MGRFSNAEKAAEARRELGMRRHVYQQKVDAGQMQPTARDRLIALMEEIAADYVALDAIDRPDMFADRPAPPPSYAHERADPMRDPTYGKTPGMNIETEGQKWSTCKCGESTLTGQVRDVLKGTLVTHRWDAKPLVHNNLNYYTRHRCG